MIKSFGDRRTEDFYHRRGTSRTRRLPSDIATIAYRKLDMLNTARSLDDLRSPPNNRLKALKGEWRGFHSIRINDQWRIMFKWESGNVSQVRIADYH